MGRLTPRETLQSRGERTGSSWHSSVAAGVGAQALGSGAGRPGGGEG